MLTSSRQRIADRSCCSRFRLTVPPPAPQGKVEEILAEVGQAIDENEVVAVVETDKVSLDIRASRPGVISAVLVGVGDEVKERQPIFVLEEDD